MRYPGSYPKAWFLLGARWLRSFGWHTNTGAKPWAKRLRWLAASIGISGLLALLLLIGCAIWSEFPVELTELPPEQSVRYEDRTGQLLREVRGHSGALAQWTPLEQVPELLHQALVAIEDRRFFSHPGIDPISMTRAAMQWAYHGRIVSGASTLSMQLARALRPHSRDLRGKFAEMALALRIEARLSKRQILEQYLNRVDFGPNLRGVAAASNGYFGKPVSALSIGEIVMLAGLPQSPSAYTLRRHNNRALARRARVIDQLVARGILSRVDGDVARNEAVGIRPRMAAFGAPHFVTGLAFGGLLAVQPALGGAKLATARRVRTTIDPVLQRQSEVALCAVLDDLRANRVTAGAVLAVDNATGDVLAYVGSPDFYAEPQQGQVDGVRALRQPGSTLKPFVYAAAFERLGYTAATVLPDLPIVLETEAGEFTPRNFDNQFRGPVRLREALGNSLNVPAIHTAATLGAAPLLEFLHRMGFTSLDQAPEYYGPALALGDGEVTLLELVRAYMAIARGGTMVPLRLVTDVTTVESGSHGAKPQSAQFDTGREERVLSESTSAILTDILKDKNARTAAFGPHSPLDFEFDAAAKTGTSKGYRDNWVVGFTGRLTVGVWVGNFDGSPMQRVGGITGAAPVFHAVLSAATGENSVPKLPLSRWEEPELLRNTHQVKLEQICPLSGELRGPHCPHAIGEYLPLDVELPTCQWHRDLALDRRNGFLAGPDCPASAVTTKSFEVFPEQFTNWAKSTGRLRAPDGYSPHCPAPSAGIDAKGPQITYPKPNSRFVIDPERPQALQQLTVEVAAPSRAGDVELLVDGRKVAVARYPFEFRWRMLPGHHRLVVASRRGEQSMPVEIDVR